MVARGSTKSTHEEGPAIHIEETYAATPLEGEETFHGASLIVHYPASNDNIAQFMRHFDESLTSRAQELGIDLNVRGLLRVIELEEMPSLFTFELQTDEDLDGHFMALPFRVWMEKPDGKVQRSNCGSFWYESSTIHLISHELAEFSLILAPQGMILGDMSFRWRLLRFRFSNGTRWFRDGVAEHLAMLVKADMLGDEEAAAQAEFEGGARLDEVGGAIFRWNNLTSADELSRSYYPASRALVERIVDQNPPGTLAAIMDQSRQHKHVDGRRLGRIIKQVTGRAPKDYLTE